MSKTLEEIAKQLHDAGKKVQLIYAFNGSGKTRLSRAFKKFVSPKNNGERNDDEAVFSRSKIIYYSAFTEDLFYWDNDLEADSEPKLKIQPNTFTDWLITLLKELGEDGNIVANFQRYTGSNVNPVFNEEYKKKIRDFNGKEVEITVPAFLEIIFQVAAILPERSNPAADVANDERFAAQGQYKAIKISKGEESNFIWSVFLTLLQQVISTLDEPNLNDRITDKFNNLKYVFIDDPVSSLDDSHLIALAVDLAGLIKNSRYVDGVGLRFVVTTHSPLFYNVLFNELNNDLKRVNPDGTSSKIYKRDQSDKYRLRKKSDGGFELLASNDHPFSYHLFLLSELRSAIRSDQVRKFHFNFLRNILEKTATFLGYPRWEDLLEKTVGGAADPFANRILNLSSHSAHAGEEVTEIEDSDKERLAELVLFLSETYRFKKQEAEND
ncbi:AAA family ATPase [Xanthomonas campestris]|uniref:AAA family ATPase n=1 Tax=Xanthomonas campestris TaxID=339 RepID=UPI003890463E